MNENSRAGGLLGTCSHLLFSIKRDKNLRAGRIYLKHDAYPEIHKRFRKIDNTLSSVVDGHAAYRQVRFLNMCKANTLIKCKSKCFIKIKEKIPGPLILVQYRSIRP